MKAKSYWKLSSILLITFFCLFFIYAQESTDAKETIVLKYASWESKSLYEITGLPWTQEIEKESKGRVKFERYPYQALMTAKGSLDGIATGMADCGKIAPPYYPGRFSMTEILFLPFTWSKGDTGWPIQKKLYDEYLYKEFEASGVRAALIGGSGGYAIFSTKPIKTIEDMKGLKIRSFGTMLPESLRRFGAVPTPLPTPEMYGALQTGVLDAAPVTLGEGFDRKIHEVAKYITILPTAGGLTYAIYPTVWSLDSWNKLPKDIQEVIERVSNSKAWIALGYDTGDELALSKLKKIKSVEIYHMPDKEAKKWVEKVNPLFDWWVNRNKAKGPAREVSNRFYKLLQKHGFR